MRNMQGELLVIKTMGIRPSFTELGRTYNLVKKTIEDYDFDFQPSINRKTLNNHYNKYQF